MRQADFRGGREVKTLVWLCAAATAFAAVDGTVVNQTSGKPQAGAVVTLFRLTQAGPQVVEAVKTDAQGRFATKQETGQVPLLLETGYQGVSYNHMLPPGQPTSNVTVSVFDTTADAAAAPVTQHIVILEPAGQQLGVTETYFFKNDGKTTYNDPKNGTLRFYAPGAPKGQVRVMATAPGGMAVQREPEAARAAGEYRLDFPIKPGGDTRIDISYTAAAADPATFAGKTFYPGAPTRLVVPDGVTLEGAGMKALGREPQTQASIYETTDAAYEVKIAGTGSLRAAMNAEAGDDSGDAGPSMQIIPPPGFEGRRAEVLVLALAVLALGFALLYRRGRAARPDAVKSRG
ncbi:MAG TPA: hypothetical protein VHA11_01065 [Bryobacteraceae bacterium]|nr:hypothetical protein [Bryobacteraceae bacterium]